MPQSTQPVIVWFRQDLRLADNPALHAAVGMEAPILPVYILDDVNAGAHALGAASRWWLHHSLHGLNTSLDESLVCLAGDAAELLPRLAADVGASGVFWNRCYEPWRIQRDKRLKARLLKDGYRVRSFNGSLLFEPPHITKRDGTPYKVFTPYYQRGCLNDGPPPRSLHGAPTDLDVFRGNVESSSVEDLKLLPSIPWYRGMEAVWTPGEQGAKARVEAFLAEGIRAYRDLRDRPDKSAVSKLSPHLHFGEVSPHSIWHAAKKIEDVSDFKEEIEPYLRQLVWREFSHYLLYYSPDLPETNLQRKFDRFPWQSDKDALNAWRHGNTGYPIIDAGMRQLWQTGYMHNRVRMLVGSFLVKNLLQDWRHGAAWFWDTLVDADLANNSASWQWVAGSGADAAPYFRIFNPVTQGKRFDPEGDYVRRYVPQLERMPANCIHSPWDAPPAVLEAAGVRLGENYPLPIVELKASRERALSAFRGLSPAKANTG